MSPIDIASNRANRKWSRKELIARALWDIAHPMFAWSPRQFWSWRRALLKLFGARIGEEVHIFSSARISIPWNITIGAHAAVGDSVRLYALGPISIGERTTISQGAHLCAGTHDYSDPKMPLLKPPITIGNDAWICADAFVGPGVRIGDRAVVGARAVVMKDVAEDAIVVGNPAREITRRTRSSEETDA